MIASIAFVLVWIAALVLGFVLFRRSQIDYSPCCHAPIAYSPYNDTRHCMKCGGRC